MKNFIKIAATGAAFSLLPIAFANQPKLIPEDECTKEVGTLIIRGDKEVKMWSACEADDYYIVRKHNPRLISGTE